MGGSNSGRWGGRRTADAASSITLAGLGLGELFRQGGEATGTATGGGLTIQMRFTVDGDRGTMALTYTLPQLGRAVRSTVTLTSVPQHFGGRRWFFLCPQTGRRVRVLYRPAGAPVFACRQFHRLAYVTTRTTARWRALNRSHKLRRRLDPETEWADPIPDKPARMHWATYDDRVARIEALDAAGDAFLVPIVERLQRQAGGAR